jgi:ribosomal protein L12E/L44/L45/RPP1/RPP2|tara:strand:+ start:379 stop:834 length:456 start_codon:yes stop_codon:yes gene_type:complete
MDTDKSQEASLLAETLRKNGIACCSTEAMEKANQIIHKTEKKEIEEDKLQLLEQKYRSLLEQNNNKVVNEINNVKDTLNSVIKEINSIKRDISQQPPVAIQEPAESQAKAEVQQKMDEVKGEKKESHPRQGTFGPEDVSIEKMFYFGKKED